MEFYAHTREGPPEQEWEKLRRHLEEVAGLANRYGDRFSAGELGEAAGLLHDAGKYSADFQARLRGRTRGSRRCVGGCSPMSLPAIMPG